MTSRQFLVPLYFLTLFLVGLGHLAILPAFEGIDEYAHYSSIRQIAGTGTIPVYGTSLLDQEFTGYQGPAVWGSGAPPFDNGMVYPKFFARADVVDRYVLAYRHSSSPSSYQPGQGLNWQAQHPPLYYILMAPIEKSAEGLPLVSRLFVLRLASYLLALAGVWLALLSARQPDLPVTEDPAILGFMLYPLVLPMFFPEFARIGNDSLCIFLAGALAFLLSRWLASKRKSALSAAIGLVLGMGLLTKAFFLPITAALAGFLLVRTFHGRRERVGQSEHWRELLLIFVPALLIGGGWYVYKFIAFGDFTGGDDAIRLARQGGLMPNLERNFSLYGVARGLVVVAVSYSWAGTWSLTRLPAVLYLPLLALAAWGFGAFALRLRRLPLTDAAWLPVWLFAAFGIGLFHHIVISVALNGNGSTPGWYLHILMPWTAPMLGIGLFGVLRNRRARPVLVGLLFYAALFHAIAIWSQIALFTGCAAKGDDKHYAFSGNAFCLDQFPVLTQRLAVLAWPGLAAACLGAGLICAWMLMRSWQAQSASARN